MGRFKGKIISPQGGKTRSCLTCKRMRYDYAPEVFICVKFRESVTDITRARKCEFYSSESYE